MSDSTFALVAGWVRREWDDALEMLRRPTMQQGQGAPEFDLIAQAERGARARDVLESELVRTFFSEQEANLVNRLTSLPIEDDAGRQRLAIAIQTVRQLRSYLLATAQGGQQAQAELERLQQPARRRG